MNETNQYEPKVIRIDSEWPPLEQDWGDQEPEKTEELGANRRRDREQFVSELRSMPDPAEEHRRLALDQIIEFSDSASGILVDLRAWLRSISDHSRDKKINDFMDTLSGISEHYLRERS